MSDLIIGGVFPLTLATLNLGIMFVVLVYMDPTLALLSLLVAPFLYASLRFYSRTMLERAERVKALEATLIERAFEILSSIAAVKSFTRERHELARFSSSGDDTMLARLTLTWQESLFSVVVTAITLAGTALVLAVGGLHVMNGTLTLGSLLVVVAYLAAVYGPLSAIAHSTGLLQQAVVSARRVREIFALTPEVLDAPDGIDASDIAGHIRFDAVSFAYHDQRNVLDSISFQARPGELVALVGLTGAARRRSPAWSQDSSSRAPAAYSSTTSTWLATDCDRFASRSLWSPNSRCCSPARSLTISGTGGSTLLTPR